MIKTITTSLLFASLLFLSCKKDPVQGPKGDKGDPGANGTLGSTTTVLVSSSSWNLDSVTSDHYTWRNTVFIQGITQDIVKKGSVSVFIQLDTKWVKLPYLDEDNVLQYSFSETLINLECFNLHATIPARPPARNIRVVTIPG